jgi:ribosomal protein S18 acetylase RimI-like enzyme
MVIRDYRPDDYQQVEKLWKETGIYTVERGDTAGIIQRCNHFGGKFLVMEDPATGSVAGTSWMTWDGRRVFLHHFAIRPSLQGQGHGRSLAIRSLEFARQRGCPVKLEVHRKNTPAVNLYRSLGFEVFEDYDVYMKLDPGE